MEVSWKKINEDTDKIIDEFDRLYAYERNYSECEKLIKSIFKIYSSKYNIQLDEKEQFDHIFQELLSGMQNTIKDFIPTDLAEQKESIRIKELFEQLSEDFFKTSEIRGQLRQIDPSNLEFRNAFQVGINEANERKTKINENIKYVDGIYKEIFGNSIPNLNNITDYEIDDIEHLNKIEQNLKEIEKLQNAIALMTDTVEIESNRREIDRLSALIEDDKNRIRRTDLVDEKRLDLININNIANSLSEITNLRNEIDSRAVTDFTTLINNLKVASRKYPHIKALSSIDFSKMDPNSMNGRKETKEGCKPFLTIYESLRNDLKIYDKEIEVFEGQIRQLDEEEKVFQAKAPTREQIAGNMPDSIKQKINLDMAFYEDLVNAQMYGNPEYKEKYDIYLKIFKNNILSGNNKPDFVLKNEDGTDILDSNGNRIIGKYMTVDYNGIEHDLRDAGLTVSTGDLLKFLQLEDYKDKLERDSRILAGDKLSLTEYKSYKAVKNARTPEERNTALLALKSERENDQLYLSTFHYATNDYEFKKQHHLTAGKIGETYIPLEKHENDEGFGKSLKVSAHNLYAYTRWQNPFKAKSILGGAGRIILNAGNLVTFVPRVLTKATGQVVSRTKYKEDKDPNPYNGRNDARRGARVDWYRENGDGPFKARAKAWFDELNRTRRVKTEREIVERHLKEIKKGLENSYISGATEQAQMDLEEQKQIVQRNREIRARDFAKIAGTWETYGDTIRDPSQADIETLKNRTMQRVALEYDDVDSEYVSNTGSRDHTKNPHRNTQFTKEKPELEGKTDIRGVKVPQKGNTRWGRKKESAISADPIGRAIRSREIKNTLTRLYAIEEAALIRGQSALVKWGIGKLNEDKVITTDSVEIQEPGHYEQTGKTVKVKSGGHFENPGTTHKIVAGVKEGNTAGNLKMGDLVYTDKAYYTHEAATSGNSPVSWIEQPTPANTQAMSVDFIIPKNLSAKDYRILSKYGLKAGDRVNYSVADQMTKAFSLESGRPYATEYINGMFNFDADTNITEAIGQYFPEKVSKSLELILNNPKYAGDKGVKFLTDSYATSHGFEKIMKKVSNQISRARGWSVESVSADALRDARQYVPIIKDIPDDPVWVADFIEKPTYRWVDGATRAIPGTTKVVSGIPIPEETLSGVVYGLEAAGYVSELHDLTRKAQTRKEPGREKGDREH